GPVEPRREPLGLTGTVAGAVPGEWLAERLVEDARAVAAIARVGRRVAVPLPAALQELIARVDDRVSAEVQERVGDQALGLVDVVRHPAALHVLEVRGQPWVPVVAADEIERVERLVAERQGGRERFPVLVARLE